MSPQLQTWSKVHGLLVQFPTYSEFVFLNKKCTKMLEILVQFAIRAEVLSMKKKMMLLSLYFEDRMLITSWI